MIIVDIYIPSLDDVFDFKIEESLTIAQVKTEIAEIMYKREKVQMSEEWQKFLLCKSEGGEILADQATVKICGIKNGSRLILV